MIIGACLILLTPVLPHLPYHPEAVAIVPGVENFQISHRSLRRKSGETVRTVLIGPEVGNPAHLLEVGSVHED